jgi:hypothetical protein
MMLDCARFILIACVLLILGTGLVAAQDQPTNPRPPRPQSPLPPDRDNPSLGSFEEEIRAKRAIKLAEKDHKENLERARQILELAKDVQSSLKDKTTIDRDSLKKMERLEKLTRKIRNEAGGEEHHWRRQSNRRDCGVVIEERARHPAPGRFSFNDQHR